MLTLKARFLEARELPKNDPYPASCLVAVLDGTETLHLVADAAVAVDFASLTPLTEVELVLRHRRIDLATLGGRGKAYRLSILGVKKKP